MRVNSPPRGRSKNRSNSPTFILIQEHKKNLNQLESEIKEVEKNIYKVEGIIEYLS